MSIKSSPPVFIVGMPRSGTTLLSNLLNASEEIYFPQETHFFSQLNKFKKNEGKLKKTFEKFYLNKNEIYFFGYWEREISHPVLMNDIKTMNPFHSEAGARPANIVLRKEEEMILRNTQSQSPQE